ncbi:hypothetical protein PQU95_14030 [Vogesella sp. DC21W]|uniref:Uncharacterized protein n=1 Tax=Vogesella aquatica TaxID=2984206 RepID=A0ABT5J0L2_9NEIS|nr:hypothetical protein [Vogesella aquatica]MDC7718327.1 hypothetical protein [Vogesella aquatica]
MLLEDLYFQQLHHIELVEPWRLDNGTPGLLAGAVLLHFEDGVLACWSPLRYGMRPTGTVQGVSVNGVLTSPGYRLSVLPAETGDKRFDLTLLRHTISGHALKDLLGTDTAPRLMLANMVLDDAMITLRLRLGLGQNSTWQLSYLPALDGSISFSPQGHTPIVRTWRVENADSPACWLLPESPYPFVLAGRIWPSAHLNHWPLALRKAWQSQPDSTAYRTILHEALAARFQQHDQLRQRLLAMQLPESVKGLPEGLLLEVVNELRRLFR